MDAERYLKECQRICNIYITCNKCHKVAVNCKDCWNKPLSEVIR